MRGLIEIGNIFKLGTKYSEPLKAYYLDEKGKDHPLVMGSYGIGPARIAAAAVEQNNDENGIIWPASIAPFDVMILPLKMNNAEILRVSEDIYQELTRKGLDVFMDDRTERAGVKFKDADLIGIREKNLKEGLVEIKIRRTGEKKLVRADEAVEGIAGIVSSNKAE